MKVERFPENPLITPARVKPSRPDFEVVCAFNAGVAEYGGEILLLLRVAERPRGTATALRVPVVECEGDRSRVEIYDLDRSGGALDFSDPRVVRGRERFWLTTLSHLRLARSKDGRKFTVDDVPALFPDRPAEAFGLEDPRITQMDGEYHIQYKSVASFGISTSLATTRDFVHFKKRGMVFCPENLDVGIFPERIGEGMMGTGRYAALTRPVPKMIGAPNMWLAYSPDLVHWGDHRYLMGVRPGMWDGGRIGGGSIPIRTERGWLAIYHGASAENVYCLGGVLLDLEEPHRVVARSARPLLVPEAAYERAGFFPNVVFTCGAVTRGDRMWIYYGAADQVMAGAEVSVREVLDSLTPEEGAQASVGGGFG